MSEEPNNKFYSFASSFINEEKDREQRRLNLIIHNVPESELAESWKIADIECATDIFNVFLGADATVTKVVRLGKNQKPDKPIARLIKVTVDTLDTFQPFALVMLLILC